MVGSVERSNSHHPTAEASPGQLQDLLASAQGLVEHLAAQVYAECHGALPREDLLAYGQQGLLEAALRFDQEKGAAFRTYAYYRVRGAMLDGLRKAGPWTRRGYERVVLLRSANEASQSSQDGTLDVVNIAGEEAAERLRKHMAAMATAMAMGVLSEGRLQSEGPERTGRAAERLVAVASTKNAEDELGDHQLLEWVKRLVEDLPHPESVVVRRFYMDGDNMDGIAHDLGRSRSWVSRVHTRALAKLEARLRREGL